MCPKGVKSGPGFAEYGENNNKESSGPFAGGGASELRKSAARNTFFLISKMFVALW